ncbi:receptor-transporting protein 3-like [Heterodontus francisci]|uniref:receptor-transporting protein 3-like n=1 Tax=Heterodontus francisci TaxID=7792 RepID=UPI00355BA6B5
MARMPGTNPWISLFTRRIEEEIEDRWTLNFNYQLNPYLEEEKRRAGWKIYTTSSFGRFDCPCSNSWSSAHVVILFHYRLRNNGGSVLLRPFRQQCRICWNSFMQKPQVNHTQKQQVFDRLISKILKNCYGEAVEEVERDLQHRKTKPHETSFCEACKLGICRI